MEERDRIYFERMVNYKNPKIKALYSNYQQDILSYPTKIRNTAKDALKENISPVIAKKEIKNLVTLIRDLNKEQTLN